MLCAQRVESGKLVSRGEGRDGEADEEVIEYMAQKIPLTERDFLLSLAGSYFKLK
jgi:hypothetical protein